MVMAWYSTLSATFCWHSLHGLLPVQICGALLFSLHQGPEVYFTNHFSQLPWLRLCYVFLPRMSGLFLIGLAKIFRL
ncbi:hypothetical protein J3458_021747 [Metarhizium acridum]|uniref:uncharacterized protein n=1 Tax=Metarhizium acridum TaxID=92637 RepID=UPI001C6C623E|nr:hypothetical protein J3458_021747 [Metarhizium acridum]